MKNVLVKMKIGKKNRLNSYN